MGHSTHRTAQCGISLRLARITEAGICRMESDDSDFVFVFRMYGI